MKIILRPATIAAVILTIASCTRNDLKIPHADDYSHVYMPQASSYPNMKTIIISDSPQAINFNAFYGGVKSPQSNITVTFAIDTLMADSFNIANGTNYDVLPQQNYRFDSSATIIPSGGLSSPSLKVIIDPVGLIANHSYLLPVRIESVSNGYNLNSRMSVTYFLVSGGYLPGEVVPWNDFKFIMPYGNNNWIVVNNKGELWNYPTDAAGNFGPPTKIGTGFDKFDIAFLYGDAMITRESGNGNLYRIPVIGNDSIGTAMQIGQGWGNAATIFGYKGALITISNSDNGLWKYPLDNNGNFNYGGIGQIGWGWGGLGWVFGCSDAILAVNGSTLWRYPLDANGNFNYGLIAQIGTGWDIFNLLTYNSNTNAIIARKPDGTLWSYPLDANDVPGNPSQIGGK